MINNDVYSRINGNEYFLQKLFSRGFYVTNKCIDTGKIAFLETWRVLKAEDYAFYVANGQNSYIYQNKDKYYVLIGHAYDPFDMIKDENEILGRLSNANDDCTFLNLFNQLTGVFTLFVVSKKNIMFVGDPSCMQSAFYCIENEDIHISSHASLLGDVLSLEVDPYIKSLTEYRFFRLLGNALPGNLSQFKNVKRLIPNHAAVFEADGISQKRFYWPHSLKMSADEVANEVSRLMSNNMTLISEKWSKPAISMTGGCDSKTTLACANGKYDKYRYFSYVSTESEQVDADAAHEICGALGLDHTIYKISDSNADFENIDITGSVLLHNSGDIIRNKPNDVRKRCYFADTDDFDVEVKSWASEIGRAYYSKRFNKRKDFGRFPTARKCTTMYKFFLHDRKLVRATDRVFEDYLNNYFEQSPEDPIDWQEQFFWEYRVPSWNGMVITGEHRYSFDITIPYNNRRILELLLSVPIELRIDDTVYKMIREKMNPEIDATGIAVTNLKHTKRRAELENIYYLLNNITKQ